MKDINILWFVAAGLLFIYFTLSNSQSRIRIHGLTPVEELSFSCPHGHRVRDGELVEFSEGRPDGSRFQIRVGACYLCGEHVMRATRSHPGSPYFKNCSTRMALLYAPAEVIGRLKHIAQDASRHGAAKKRLGL